jgi:hypothetical protein
MTLNRILALLIGVGTIATSALAEADESLVPAQECRPRAGLTNFFAKANTPGADIKIAYFGGSITAQTGYRVKTLAWFKEAYPQAKFSEINAAIGGTGSDLGVFRLKQDVLDQKPDLMFVEFAVNDGGAAPELIQRCMEGIVRQTWRALPELRHLLCLHADGGTRSPHAGGEISTLRQRHGKDCGSLRHPDHPHGDGSRQACEGGQIDLEGPSSKNG